MGNVRARILAASMSTAVGLVVAYFALRGRFEEPPTVRLVEDADDVATLFGARDEGSDPAAAPVSEGGEVEGNPALSPLLRRPLGQQQVAKLYGKTFKGMLVYDPDTLFWERPNRSWKQRFAEHPRREWQLTTNASGCRQSTDLREETPDLRILITGDSHTAGVVPLEENFAFVLEDALMASAPDRSVESINAGKGGFDFYNYIGVLDKFADAEPDVFVLAVFGGNDFMACVRPYRYFNNLPPLPTPDPEESLVVRAIGDETRGLIPQDLNQLTVFRRSPMDVEYASIAAKQMLVSFRATCAERDIEFLLVLIPPCGDVQRDIIQPEFDDAVSRLHLSEADLEVSGKLADQFLEDAEELGVRAIDMRPIFRASEEPCYWRSDLHINTLGHALVARELEAALRHRLED